MRVQQGEQVRFESVTELIDECRFRYSTLHVRTATRGGEFLLYVKLPDGARFESLIVHHEAEGRYAATLPALPLAAAERVSPAPVPPVTPPPAPAPTRSWLSWLRRA